MNSDNYNELYDIFLELQEKRNQIQEKINDNLERMQQADYFVANFSYCEDNDFKIFSPRNEERLHKEQIEKSKSEKSDLQKVNGQLGDELKRMDLYIQKIEKIISTEKESNATKNRDRNLAVLKIQEEDRQRIARDLHDTALQDLAHIIHKVELSSIFMEQDTVRAKLEMSVIKKDLKRVIDEIRDAVYDLRSMTFDDLGLRAAFEALFQTINADMKYTIESEIEDVSCENSLMMVTVYRIVQECICNIVKHAQADKIIFKYGAHGNHICIDVNDNGKGFQEAEVTEKQCKHFGLSVMKERVKLLDGTIEIQSDIGEGTNIHIEIPFDN
ncbi:MAG: histidine kinase [Roseburia sp.]|nr:histidine kinase [Roseburia sp.]